MAFPTRIVGGKDFLAPHRASGGETANYRTREARFGGGYRQRVVDGANAEEITWRAAWRTLPIADVLTITDYIRERAGRPFVWNPPGDTSNRRWTCDSIRTNNHRGHIADLSATFVLWNG